MQKLTPYLANGCPKTCWSCGKPFVVRQGHAEAIVGPRARLYCDRNGCEEAALVPQAYLRQHASATSRAA